MLRRKKGGDIDTMEKIADGFNLIEGPVWDSKLGLIFSDAVDGGVYALSDAGDVTVVYEHRKGIGGIARHAQNGLVVSGRNVAFKPFGGGETNILLDRDATAGVVGFNDLTTDERGRIYVGSLSSSPLVAGERAAATGHLYLIDLDGSSRIVAEDIRLNNGLAFSPDGATLYHSDSIRRTVYQYAVEYDGTLGEKQIFAKVDKGGPDGLVVSADGRVWVALAGGGHGVSVFNPDGSASFFLEIPQPMCTSVCFGGDDLNTLYVVSGSEGMGTDNAGAVYRSRTDVPGLAVPPARISLN